MKEKFAAKSVVFITKYYNYEGKKLDKLNYGLQAFYSLITKTFVILLISLLLNTLKETLFLILFYGLMRCFAFGIHASKNIYCWISSIIIYSIIPLISKYVVFPEYVFIIIIVFSLLSFLLFAPADTIKKPLVNPKKRLFCKCATVIVACLLIIISILLDNQIIKNIIVFSIIIQAVIINPFTYFIFRQSYNNYKHII